MEIKITKPIFYFFNILCFVYLLVLMFLDDEHCGPARFEY